MTNYRILPAFLLILLLFSTGCAVLANPTAMERLGESLASAMPAEAERLVPLVLAEYPHDTDSYTQGLLIVDGIMYESDGGNSRYGGESSLRKVDPQTGEILLLHPVPDPVFAEGLALVNDQLIQLTWQDGKAFVYDSTTFRLLGAFEYEGEGWGLCYDGRYLYMTDGSNAIFVREPDTFEIVREIGVHYFGQPVNRLNELECVGNEIYANIYLQDLIVRINKFSGNINAVIDASQLLTAEECAELLGDEVLNGIAYDAENDLFYITGKNWSKLFAVQFVPYEGEVGE